MNILSNIGKSSLLAMSIFWVINLTYDFNCDYIPFVFLSLIPIYFCCAIVILLTICPIFWFSVSEVFNRQQIFKTYFPIYAILIFGLCSYGIYKTKTDTFAISFFVSAYISTLHSWMWFAKPKKSKPNERSTYST